jgi:hypothetical protein
MALLPGALGIHVGALGPEYGVRPCTPNSRRGLGLALPFLLTAVTPPVDGVPFGSNPVMGPHDYVIGEPHGPSWRAPRCAHMIGTWSVQVLGVVFVLASLYLLRRKLTSATGCVTSTGDTVMADQEEEDGSCPDCVYTDRECPLDEAYHWIHRVPIGVYQRDDYVGAPNYHPSSSHFGPTAAYYVCAQCNKRFGQFWSWAAVCPNCDYGSRSSVNGITAAAARRHVTIQQERRVQTKCIHRPMDRECWRL